MKYKGQTLNSRDIATIELLDEIRTYFDEGGAALNALALGGVRAEDYATTSYVDDSIAGLVDSAPDTLDTLGELAAALKDNEDIVAALDAAITNKAEQSDLEYQAERIDGIESTINNLHIPTNLSEFNNDVGFITESAIEGLITEQYADGKYATIAALDNFLPKTGGEVDELGVNVLTVVEGYIENLRVDYLSINGDAYIDSDYKLNFSQENSIYGTQGGNLYIVAKTTIDLISDSYIAFGIGDDEIASINSDGIHCASFRSISFSFGADDRSEYMYIEQGEIILNTGVVTITGDLVVHGSIAAGGKGEEGDSALADLEARVAALESLIS